MKQREIVVDGVRWTCNQALAGVDGEAAAKAESKIASSGGKVPVICTPDGGAQSVRVTLDAGWDGAMTDDELLSVLRTASQAD